jgi:hypothetical protein
LSIPQDLDALPNPAGLTEMEVLMGESPNSTGHVPLPSLIFPESLTIHPVKCRKIAKMPV